MTTLLDANVLIALTDDRHVHHDAAQSWFAAGDRCFATSPSTEGTLVRHVLRRGATAVEARELLVRLGGMSGHEFWADAIGYADVDLHGVIGHRQVTDAYLASSARVRGGRVATFDRGLAVLHADVTELLPT